MPSQKGEKDNKKTKLSNVLTVWLLFTISHKQMQTPRIYRNPIEQTALSASQDQLKGCRIFFSILPHLMIFVNPFFPKLKNFKSC